MRVGWQEMKRVYHTTMHFDIKDGKIWIQQNMTDVDVGQELVDLGVPKEDIIWGYNLLTSDLTQDTVSPNNQ
jgi:XisI protein